MKNKRGQMQPVVAAATEIPATSTPAAAVPVENQITAQPAPDQQPAKKSKKWLWIIIIAIIAISVIGLVAWFLLASGEGGVVGNGIGSSAPTPPKFPS